MSCGLGEKELWILNLLYTNRNFTQSSGYNSKKLERIYSRKFSNNIKPHTQVLLNEGYISQIRKKDIKYYILDKKKTSIALGSHGYNVTMGRERPV
ncbi:MAG: hypothetical protein KAR56_02535 [Thermoplasmata archaeon]|nr:hypothetical protein [Thermoplasmata archaeon]